MVEDMRTIRLEDNFDEASLPKHIGLDPAFSKVADRVETPKLKTASKYDKASKSLAENYREDIKTQ